MRPAGLTSHHAKHPILIEGDPHPVHLSRSRPSRTHSEPLCRVAALPGRGSELGPMCGLVEPQARPPLGWLGIAEDDYGQTRQIAESTRRWRMAHPCLPAIG